MNNRAGTAILFSGGLDSLCAAVLAPQAKLIRVATGSRYDAVEAVHAQQVAAALGRTDDYVAVDGVLDLGRYEQDNALVPARNALIALVAAQHARDLQLIAVDGDGTHATDKDASFAAITTALILKLFGDGGLTLPVRKWSKLRLLQEALVADYTAVAAALPHVWSCYAPADVQEQGIPWSHATVHCGQCKACIRLCGALGWSGMLQHGPTFAVNPCTLPMSRLQEVYAGRGNEERSALAFYTRATHGRLA